MLNSIFHCGLSKSEIIDKVREIYKFQPYAGVISSETYGVEMILKLFKELNTLFTRNAVSLRMAYTFNKDKYLIFMYYTSIDSHAEYLTFKFRCDRLVDKKSFIHKLHNEIFKTCKSLYKCAGNYYIDVSKVESIIMDDYGAASQHAVLSFKEGGGETIPSCEVESFMKYLEKAGRFDLLLNIR